MNDIHHLIQLYARHEASEEQCEKVRQAILDDTDLFIDLLLAKRREAMKNLGMNPKEDFLPSHLQACAPEAYGKCASFSHMDGSDAGVSASLPIGFEEDIFKYLCDELL